MADKTATITIDGDSYELPASLLGQIVSAATVHYDKADESVKYGLYREFYQERKAVCNSIQEFISENVEIDLTP